MEKEIDFQTRVKVYDQAIDTFGVDKQLVVAVEELSELQKEVCKALRYEKNAINEDNMAEEIADVMIMVEQLQRIFQIGELVETYRSKKIRRLAKKLDMQFVEDSPIDGDL